MFGIAIAQGLINASAHTPFSGSGGYAPDPNQLSAADHNSRYRQAAREREGAGEFFDFFSVPVDIAGKAVLDFGCGYGGKTVAFAETAAWVSGIEPVERHIEMAKGYAADVPNVDFKLCGNFDIPYPDEAFDVVLSHDVLEHVANPRTSLEEIWRVLKPGGKAYIIFPPYDGLYSHHLDYVSRLPTLHWWFKPETLVAAVNRILSSPRGKAFNTALQSEPELAWTGKRKVLPMLNGLTGADFEAAARERFEIAFIDYRILGHRQASLAHKLVYHLISRPMMALGLKEHMTTGISAVLRKPA